MIPKFYPNAKWWVIKDRRMPRRNDPRAWIKIGTYHPWDFEPIDEIPDAIREHYEAGINGIGIASIRGLTAAQLDSKWPHSGKEGTSLHHKIWAPSSGV